jgi:hypothetical protein
MEQTTMLKKMHWQNGTWNNHNPGSFKKISVWKILDYLLGGITIQSYANFECFGEAPPPPVRHLHYGWITMPSTDLTSCPKAPSTNDCRSTQRLNLDVTLSLCHRYHVVTICNNAFQQLAFSSSASSSAASYCRHLHHPMTVNIASLKQKPWMSSDQPICQEIGSPSESLSFW